MKGGLKGGFEPWSGAFPSKNLLGASRKFCETLLFTGLDVFVERPCFNELLFFHEKFELAFCGNCYVFRSFYCFISVLILFPFCNLVDSF